jgi:hypothetical protein
VAIRVPKPGEKTDFTPCPAGWTAAVCVDVVDLGMVDTGFLDEKTGGPRIVHKIRLAWQTAKKMDDGRPFVINAQYTASFNEYKGKKASLLRDVNAWGVALQDLVGEDNEYDAELLIGRPCFINVVHNVVAKDGKTYTYANVGSIGPLPDGMTVPVPSGYTRVKDRETTVKAAVDGEELDGDLPF